MLRALNKLLDPLRRRIRLILTRAILNLVDDAKGLQLMQVTALADETLDGCERFQDYGFTSVPHPGAELLAGAVGGNRAHTVIIKADDRRYRLKALEDGEVALYDDLGQKVHLKRDGILVFTPATVTVEAGEKVFLDTPLVQATGDLVVGGNASIGGDASVSGDITDRAATGGVTMAHMRDVYDGHTHDENDSGGPTDTPSEEMD